MSSYHTSFSYLGFNTKQKNLEIGSFDPDNGFMDTFLSKDIVETNTFNGDGKFFYGAKYNSTANISITLIKNNHADFKKNEIRDILRWLSSSKIATWMDMYKENDIEYSFFGLVTNIEQYKLDSRCVGIKVTFSSISPWAYSKLFTEKVILPNEGHTNGIYCYIENNTDELNECIYLNLKMTNIDSTYLKFENRTFELHEIVVPDNEREITLVKNLKQNEEINITSGQFIYSNFPNRIFGDDFSFIWPKIFPGRNKLFFGTDGHCTYEISYRYPIKIGNCSMDI